MPQADVPACLAVDTTVSVPVLGSLGDGTPALVDAARIALTKPATDGGLTTDKGISSFVVREFTRSPI